MQPAYDILLGLTTLEFLINYKKELQTKKTKPGYYLQKHINSLSDKGIDFDKITNEQFIQMLLLTKKICCFAESEITGNGSDWNSTELKILGDISVAMDVEVYDNGAWSPSEKAFKMHVPPMAAKLLFTPGPLLFGRNFSGSTPDFEEVFYRGQIDQNKYKELIKRRLLPVFVYVNENAKKENKKAIVVIPGLGCGSFAGRFQGKMGEYLNKSLQAILKESLLNFGNIACVRYDPYSECSDFEETINNVKFRVRKNVGSLGKPQLSCIDEFEETEHEFENCSLYKVVAWDHVSLPGNDFFLGSRNTDDGVTAAATNSMELITGVKGKYNLGYYNPPTGDVCQTWKYVAKKNNTRLIADGNVKIALHNGTCTELTQFTTE